MTAAGPAGSVSDLPDSVQDLVTTQIDLSPRPTASC